ncbi:hypothetical protein GLOIN_2v1481686 [Rhizophagus clarus]|uniref:Uncharacterized protein n=1 Tax=Rhizophagus clarus TaxID=94130 RepID=A0A8H3LXS3_9GLOM|nr:hypothetical protein GLOIN_2v1481686 [Rhizophagus clarus]
MGREKPDWKSAFKKEVELNFFDVVTCNNSYPFILESNELTKSSSQIFWQIDSLDSNTNEHKECEDLYNQLITTTENILQILKEQKATENLKWAKSVKKIFIQLLRCKRKLNHINAYKKCL